MWIITHGKRKSNTTVIAETSFLDENRKSRTTEKNERTDSSRSKREK